MKTILFILCFTFSFSFYHNLKIGIEVINNFQYYYSTLSKAVDEMIKIKSNSENKNNSKNDEDWNELKNYIKTIIKFLGNYENEKEKINKLKELLDRLENFDHLSTILGGAVFVGERVTNNFIKNAGKSISDMQKTFCNENMCSIPTKKMKDTIGSISQNYQFTKNVGNIFTGLGIIGQGYSFYSNFNQKFKKCNNKNADAAAKALLETGANTAKNLASSYFGTALGTLIPVPIVGPALGGIIGNYVGNLLNSQIDIDC